MKHLSLTSQNLRLAVLSASLVLLAFFNTGCNKIRDYLEPELKIKVVATGFAVPIGVETDDYGRIWVAESGTGNNDGKVSVVTPDGKKYPVFINFESHKIDNGDIDGLNHILISEGILYILGGHGIMYKAGVSSYHTGDAPKNASTLATENIGAFVLDYDFKNKIYESHPYNLAPGPNGDIFITDAASNAVLRRTKNGVLSVLAEIPGVANPTPVGPPFVESVPTSVFYDGRQFLVTTLLGFPFPEGQAVIYKVAMNGSVSIYQKGFTSLVDLAEGGRKGRLLLEHGKFGPMGFIANSGRLVWANGTSITELADGLNKPAGLKQVNDHTWYVTSTGDGTLLKVTYQ